MTTIDGQKIHNPQLIKNKIKRMDPKKRKQLDDKLRAMLEMSEKSTEKLGTVTARPFRVDVIRRRKGSPEKRI